MQARKLAFVNHSDITIPSYAGYFTVNKTHKSNLFFWYFPAAANVEKAPVLLWLQGIFTGEWTILALILGFSWISMSSHELFSIFYDILWSSTNFHYLFVFSWFLVNFIYFLWIFMISHEFSRFLMIFHDFSWFFIVFYDFSWIPMTFFSFFLIFLHISWFLMR